MPSKVTFEYLVPTCLYVLLLYLGGYSALAFGATTDVGELLGQACVLAVIILAAKLGLSDIGSFGRFNVKSVLVAAGAGIILQLASDIFIFAVSSPSNAESGTVAPSAAMVLSHLLAAPVVEELVFRGFTMSILVKRFDRRVANIVQAALFAVCHTSPIQVVYAFACGIVLGKIAERYGLVYSIEAHAVCNALGFLPFAFLG